MNVEIWTEATPFPEKEYINGISFAVYMKSYLHASIRENKVSNLKKTAL
jgi:hypothetical protein